MEIWRNSDKKIAKFFETRCIFRYKRPHISEISRL